MCNLFSLFLLSFKTVHSNSQHLFKGLYFIPLKANVKQLLLERVNVPPFPFFGFVFETGSLYIYSPAVIEITVDQTVLKLREIGCLCLSSTGIKGICHRFQPTLGFF